jgi:PAS domain S-box-containing protein
VELTISPVLLGKTYVFNAFVRDISERKRAETATRRLAAIVESSDDAIIGKTLDGTITSWNSGAEHQYGYTAAEVLGKPISILVPPGHTDEIAKILELIKNGSGIHQYETGRVRKGGQRIEVSVTVSPIKDADGIIVGASAIARDITDRKRAEEKFKGLLESAPDAMVILNQRGEIVLVNAQTEKLFGYPREELIGQSAAAVAPEGFRLQSTDGLHDLFGLRKDGGQFPLEIRLNHIDTEEGVLIIAAIRDISERKRAEEEIRTLNADLERRATELAATNEELEAFSYSVSHDLRAPLRSMAGFSQSLLEDYQDRLDAQGQDYLKRVRGAAKRMGQLIDDMLSLSRVTRSEMRYERVDLSAIAAEIAAELRESEPDRHVELKVQNGLADSGDAELLRVALENLLANAWKFTSKHSTACIEFAAAPSEGGTRAYFVRDDGAGFDMAYADKLFGAFQRLHGAEFPGTGIGLATVQRVVRRHGGRVWGEGSPEHGATFYFTLQPERTEEWTTK